MNVPASITLNIKFFYFTNVNINLKDILKISIAKIERVAEKPPYNYLIHTAPHDTKELKYYHWHFEIFPRLTKIAGFEWATGFYINPLSPEAAAGFLREAGE